EEAASELDAKLAAICRQHGIPEKLRPQLGYCWASRGENALSERRGELRRVAQARIEAIKQTALTTIMANEAEALTSIVATGLTSGEARSFLDAMPTPEQLMPPIVLQEIEDGMRKKLALAGEEEEDDV